MKNFLRAAINITWFQLITIIGFGVLKFWISTSELSSQLLSIALILGAILFIILLSALGIIGVIENKGITYQSWVEQNVNSKKHRLIARYVTWGQAIPAMGFYACCMYLFAPTSLIFFVSLLGFIVLTNIISYSWKKMNKATEK